jgi:hypothetical protein
MDWSNFLVDEKERVYCISLLLLLRVQISLFALVCVSRSFAVLVDTRDDDDDDEEEEEEEEEEKWPSDVIYFVVGREIENQRHRKAVEIECVVVVVV